MAYTDPSEVMDLDKMRARPDWHGSDAGRWFCRLGAIQMVTALCSDGWAWWIESRLHNPGGIQPTADGAKAAAEAMAREMLTADLTALGGSVQP